MKSQDLADPVTRCRMARLDVRVALVVASGSPSPAKTPQRGVSQCYDHLGVQKSSPTTEKKNTLDSFFYHDIIVDGKLEVA